MSEWSERVFMVCATLVCLACIAAFYENCNKTDERRIECVKLGHSPDECKKMLNSNNAN